MNTTIAQPLPDERCFLCSPAKDLVFRESENFLALAGLGPVVEDYCVVAAKRHFRSMADTPRAIEQEKLAFVNELRGQLAAKHGSCLMTEHGRMAVCATDEHDHHCFHAHFLLFPGAPDITTEAKTYFGGYQQFVGLPGALQAGAEFDQYFLVSTDAERYGLFSTPLNAPRQLARYLVSARLGSIELADWKAEPNRDRAVSFASRLREIA